MPRATHHAAVDSRNRAGVGHGNGTRSARRGGGYGSTIDTIWTRCLCKRNYHRLRSKCLCGRSEQVKIEGAIFRFRPVRMSDTDAVREILADWSHDRARENKPSRFDVDRTRRTVSKWVDDMRLQPIDVPLTDYSFGRQALICYVDATSDIPAPPQAEMAVGLCVFRWGRKAKRTTPRPDRVITATREDGTVVETENDRADGIRIPPAI